jgi:hypothetical protein
LLQQPLELKLEYKNIHEGYFTRKRIILLAHGALVGHFGFPYGTGKERADLIISTIIQNIEVNFRPFKRSGDHFKGGLTVGVLVDGFTDLLELDVSTVTTEKGRILPWLEWLLKRGRHIIIEEYEVQFIPGKGRSGQAIMIPGSWWQVPAEHSGTEEDNWLTRSLFAKSVDYASQINNIVSEELG